MSNPELKKAVLSQLNQGAKYAVKGNVLAARLNERNTRAIRLAIEELIADGIPICSSPHKPYGYFIADNLQEVNDALKILRYGYGLEIFRHYRNLKRAAHKQFSGQLVLRI